MMNENCYQSELDKFATSLSVLGSCRQTCSRPFQFGLKKLVAILVCHSTALVMLGGLVKGSFVNRKNTIYIDTCMDHNLA